MLAVLLVQGEAPPLPPGWRRLDKVGARVISFEGVRVAKVELWVDLPALHRHLVPGSSGASARQLLTTGQVRVLARTTYLVDIGAHRRRQRLEAFFAAHWPNASADLSKRPTLLSYLDKASKTIAMGEVQLRAVEPGWGLWFRVGAAPWCSYGDPDLATAWARGELGSEQDPDYAKGVEADLARLLAAQRAR